MKKAIKFVSIFTFILTVFSCVFFISKVENVEAGYGPTGSSSDFFTTIGECVETTPCEVSYKHDGNEVGKITISKNGEIKVEYKYGISEILVYVEKCLNLTDAGDGCKSWDNASKHVIHVSGDYTKRVVKDNKWVIDTWGSKIIHLFEYFDYSDLLKVSIITDFATADNFKNDCDGTKEKNCAVTSSNYDTFHDVYNDGFFYPSFCNADAGITNCTEEKEGIFDTKLMDRKKARLSSARVEGYTYDNVKIQGFVEGLGVPSDAIHYADNKRLIYAGNASQVNKNYAIMEVVVLVDNTMVDGASGDVETIIFDTIIPALLVILGIAAGVSIAVLGYQIVKSADEPQERQDKIRRLRNILIGLALAFVVLLVAEPITDFVKQWIE